MIQKKIGFQGFCIFLIVLVQLFCFYPYEFSSIYFLNLPQEGGVMHAACILLTAALVILNLKNLSGINRKVLGVMLIQFLGYLICNIAHNNFNLTIGQLLVFVFCFFILLLMNSSIGIINFFKLYNRWIFIMAILGTTTWFLVNYFDYSALYSSIDFQNEDRFIDNYLLTFANHNDDTSKFAYSGFFDENGAMGLWGLFALVINKVFVKEEWLEIPLIICLLFTFSMGFYLQLFFYLLFFYVNKTNKSKAVFFVVMGVGLIILVSTLKGTELDFVYEKTIGRFTEMTDTRNNLSLAGTDNRADLSATALAEFQKNPFWGTSNDQIEVGDNIYEPLAMYGLLGTFIIYFPFIWILIKSIKRKEYLISKAIIIIMMSFFHRPFHSHIIWMIQLYGFMTLYLEFRELKNNLNI